MKKSFLKYVAVALSGALLLGGCGAGAKSQPEQEVRSEQERQADAEDVAQNISDEVKADAVPTILITQDSKEWYSDDGETLLLTEAASRVEVTNDGFDALKDALLAQWGGLGSNSDEILPMAKEHYEMNKSDGLGFDAYSYTKDVLICRNDSNVISLCERFYEYTGGAHGMYGVSGRTFDVKSGRELQLDDILSNPEAFYEKAIEYILQKLPEIYGEDVFFPEYKETVRTQTFGGDYPASWYLDVSGIVIDYNIYTLAPYAAGAQTVTLPYGEFAEYIKEEYGKPSENIVAIVSENEDISMLLGENGRVMVETAYDSENDGSNVTVVSGNAREEVGDFRTVAGARVIKRDGRSFVIFVCDYASDDFVTFVYEVTGGKAIQCDRLEGAGFGWSGDVCIGTDRIGLYKRLEVLGSYSGWMEYSFGSDGKLTPMSDIYVIGTSGSFGGMTVVKDLPVTLEGKDTMLSAGTKLKITGTDNNGTAYFMLDTGETGEIKYVRIEDQWGLMINGVSEFEYFDMVPYAG